jgi:hypothetical protein
VLGPLPQQLTQPGLKTDPTHNKIVALQSGLWIRIDSIRIQKFSSIRIRIHNVIESRSNPDPDPQQYLRRQIFSKIKNQQIKAKDITG